MTGGILVTGARGWLGRALVSHLARAGVPGVQALGRPDLDCADADRVEAVLADLRPRTVVHLAASLDRSSATAQWRDTFDGGRTIVQVAARVGVPHLLLAGTMEELGPHPGVLTPDLPSQPSTPYGLCKSLVREVASFETRIHPSLRVDWFRATTLYGPGQQGSMLVPAACAAASQGLPASFTSGEQRRDFLYVDDLVRWMALAVDERVGLAPDRGFHLHHLGTGAGVAVREVLALIAGQFPRSDFRIGDVPRRPHEPMLQVAPRYTDANPWLATWSPAVSWQDGVRRTVDWWRSHDDAAEARPIGSTA